MDKPTAIPTSIEQPTLKSKGTDPAKVKRALNALDPARVLSGLEKPSRPAWTEILHDWAEVDMPRSVFEPWEVRQLERDSSVYWEYDAKRQRLGIRCVPTAIHEAPADSFRAQTFQELSRLSRKSQDLFRVGSNTGIQPPLGINDHEGRLLIDCQSSTASISRSIRSAATKCQTLSSWSGEDGFPWLFWNPVLVNARIVWCGVLS